MTSILLRSDKKPAKRMKTKKILIGRVASAHGLDGTLKIIPLTDFPERFKNMNFISLYDKHGDFKRKLKIFGAKTAPDGRNLIIDTELEDRYEAAACAGMNIFIDANERVKLPPDTFWIDDLLGLKVEDSDGNVLGKVTDIIQAGANELYEIRDSDGKPHYVPAVKEFIRDINLETGLIKISLIDGLWD